MMSLIENLAPSWRNAGILALSLSLSAVVGCSTGIDDYTDSPTPEPAADTLTIKVDTTTKADGTNALAAVNSGEQVFIVGSFTAWNPNYAGFELTSEGAGIYSITLSFPLEAYEYDGTMVGAAKTFNVGDELEFKFAKTSADVLCDPASTTAYVGECWSEGQKDYKTQTEKACPAAPTAAGGLWEVTNTKHTIAAGHNTLDTFVVEAWRTTGESYGYKSCD